MSISSFLIGMFIGSYFGIFMMAIFNYKNAEAVIKEKDDTNEADKLFENLGYKKIIDDDREITYQYKKYVFGELIENFITFKKLNKLFAKYYEDSNDIKYSELCTMLELQAIYLKCKELGWSDENGKKM